MKRRIIIDGIEVEGAEARRIVHEVLRDADGSGRPRRRFPLVMVTGAAVCAGVASGIMSLVLRALHGSLSELWIAVICFAVAFVVGTAWVRIHLRLRRRQLREAMCRRGFELCTNCGYWLRGHGPDATHCPECGAERTKRDG